MNGPDEPVTAAIQNLRRPKHGARTLRWRQKNRPARRARLSNTWSRVMAMVDHPLAAMAKLAPATMHPKLTGPARKRWARRWARNRLKKLRAAVRS